MDFGRIVTGCRDGSGRRAACGCDRAVSRGGADLQCRRIGGGDTPVPRVRAKRRRRPARAGATKKGAWPKAAASEASTGQASLAHGYTAVIAPYSGIVAARHVEVGELVMPGKPLMAGFAPAEMRVVGSVPQDQLVGIGAHP